MEKSGRMAGHSLCLNIFITSKNFTSKGGSSMNVLTFHVPVSGMTELYLCIKKNQ